MKQTILYLNILMFLLITSCSNDDIIVPTPQNGAEKGTCEVSFWTSIPDVSTASRGNLGEATASSVESLKLLVFDAETGIYLYGSDATLSNRKLENGIHKGEYKVQLQLSDKKRIVHFVANVSNVPYQANEITVLSQLSTENNQDAYWQRVEVESITGELTEAGTYTNVNAAGITGETIQLVRNFARITLQAAESSGFTLAGFVLVNTANKGTVAPYLKQAGSDGNYFPDYDTANETVDGVTTALSKYTALIAAGYTGVQPSDVVVDSTVPVTPETVTESNPDPYTTAAKYLYERTQEENPVFIIAKRTMKDAGNNTYYRYYKIDILKKGVNNEKDEYYRILRNFSYDITINSVEGEGYETPAEAAANAAGNNLSTSEELMDLTNIAYGNERLFVSKTEIVWTSENDITFKYKYLNNGTNSNTTVTSLIFGDAKNVLGEVYDSNKNYTINSSVKDADDYSVISIPHTVFPTSGYKEQEVTIKAGTLSRTINLILIKPYENSLGCSGTTGLQIVPTSIPEIARTVSTPVYVYFSLPASLPESIFPLTFILSPEAHSITPTGGDMPVVSLLNHENATMKGLKYGFEKVITWDDYDDNVTTGMVVECPFKTSLAASATNIYLYNEYFTLKSTSFTNPEPVTKEASKTLTFRYQSNNGGGGGGGSSYTTIANDLSSSSDGVTLTDNDNTWTVKVTYTEGEESNSITFSYTRTGGGGGGSATYSYTMTIAEFLELEDNDTVTLTRQNNNN